VPHERSAAFAPGRVNLIGEHTDYNEGLALPFAIAAGTTVRAERLPSSDGEQLIEAHATDLGESDEFPLEHPGAARGWRAFVRGMAAELRGAGYPLVGARLSFGGDVPQGAGLSSSAALEVALCLALLELGSEPGSTSPLERVGRTDIAQLCSRVERDWVGAKTGLLDQLASLCGAEEQALCIDFRSLRVEPVPLRLGDWRLVVLDSGERHAHASSGYNERREECASACRLLAISSLRDADERAAQGLPEPLRRRVAHVLSENRRVGETVEALRADDLPAVGELLDASHASLREDYEISTPAVEAAVARLRSAGASGARLVGGGFGGSVLGLFAPGREPPAGAREVRPGAGARMLAA
jgi:galactokinase